MSVFYTSVRQPVLHFYVLLFRDPQITSIRSVCGCPRNKYLSLLDACAARNMGVMRRFRVTCGNRLNFGQSSCVSSADRACVPDINIDEYRRKDRSYFLGTDE